jgi:glycosyltransferase involved in cell wall biosynthesis
MMKIAFVNSRYAPHEFGGAERIVRILAESLVERGHQVSAISISPNAEAAEGELNGVKTYYVPLANIFHPWQRRRDPVRRAIWHLIDAYNPIMGHRVGKILDKEKPDVVDTSNLIGFSVAVWRAARKRNIPIVQALHDYYLGCPNSSMLRGGKNCTKQCGVCRVYGLPRRALSNIPSAVVSVSDRTLRRLEDCGLFTEVPTKTVIHGIGNATERPPERDASETEGPLRVGFLGRIEPTKGLDILLDAAREAKNVRVLVGGSGAEDYVEGLKARYASERVEFAGYVRPDDFFRRIDVLALPSIWEEPLPRVIYEAYAYGVPVIIPRAGGMPEIVEQDRTGFIVTLGDRRELTELLNRLSSEWSSSRFFDACLAKSKEFNTEHRFEKFYDVWTRAAASSTARAEAAE